MPVNLLNEKDLNNYLADIVYHGQEMEVFKSGNFKSTAFVEQNKDAIVRSMLMQWCKHRLRLHLTEDIPEHRYFLSTVTADEPNLPAWAERCLAEKNPIYRFEGNMISERLTGQIALVRDYLYAKAESYVNKTLARVKDTNAKGQGEVTPKLRIDYLKTQDAYENFEKTLSDARKWHEITTEKTELRKRNEQMYQASLAGTKKVMNLSDGMEVVQLTTPEALDYETECMGHCAGKGGYDKEVVDGAIKIYSLRDADGLPHATFEVRVNNETQKEEVHQCKGKGDNIPVAKYLPYVQEFVKKKDFDIVRDAVKIGLIQQDGKYYDLWNLPKGFVIKGDLNLSNLGLTELPDLSDVTVEGYFSCSNNNITSLKNSPKKVNGGFYCYNNNLTSLDGVPQEINGDFHCWSNELTSLEGGPQTVHGDMNCSGNQLTSLKGAPQKVDGEFKCLANMLTSLRYIPVCKSVYSDINTKYVPHTHFGDIITYKDLEASPHFQEENKDILLKRKRSEIKNKILRKEAAKNVSPIKGDISLKRTGLKKTAAKINIAFAHIKQMVKR